MNSMLKKEIAWAGFEMRVPSDWEMSRHSRALKSGSLTLVDRRRQRLELTWQDCDRTPDLQRSCEDLRDRFCQEGYRSDQLPRLKSVPGWIGFRRRLDEHSFLVHALRWQQESGRIFQVTIVAFDDEVMGDGRLVEDILGSCVDNAFEGNAIRWQAFGIDCTTPPGWELVSTRIYPMDVELKFSDRGGCDGKGESEALVHRLGMAAVWFNGDAESYVRSKEPGLDFRFGHTEHAGHLAVTAVAASDRRLYHRLTGGNRIRRELIWLCEHMNAVFRAVTLSPPKKEMQPKELMLRCSHHRSADYG